MKIQNIAKFYISLFGSGYAPKAPGTVGSIVSIPILIFLQPMGLIVNIVIFLACLFSSIWAINLIEKQTNEHDSKWIVIDEYLGMQLILMVSPILGKNFEMNHLYHYGLIFLLFRIFDIAKPWPVSHADKKIGGGFGVILDDLLAATYALIVYIFSVNMGIFDII